MLQSLPKKFSVEAMIFTATHAVQVNFNLTLNATLIFRGFLATGGETDRLAWFASCVLSLQRTQILCSTYIVHRRCLIHTTATVSSNVFLVS
jgi:hypothetical protein